MNIWSIHFTTVLSVTFINLAFFYADQWGISIIPGCAALIMIIIKKRSHNSFLLFMSWALGICVPHFVWIYALLVNNTRASALNAIICYTIITAYFVIIITCWLYITHRNIQFSKKQSIRIALCILSLSGLEHFIRRASVTPFTGYQEGYPFLNPLIPLGPLLIKQSELPTNMIYLKPPDQRSNPQQTGQEIFHTLTLHTSRKNTLFIAPESSFPYPLNEYPGLINLWKTALVHNNQLLIGTQWEEDKLLYQSACLLSSQGIDWVQKKHHLIGYVEQLPTFVDKDSSLAQLFLSGVQAFSPGKKNNTIISIHNNKCVIYLCSELFFTNTIVNSGEIKFIFFLLNDSWFIDYFRKIIENLTYIKSWWLNLPIISVGHHRCQFISRKGLHECLHVKRC